jgi:hypothetical protein
MATTQVVILPTEYTAVATEGQGPGVFTAVVRGGVFYRVGTTKPSAGLQGHYLPFRAALDLTKPLSTGKSLWMRGAVQEDGPGECIITLDSAV